MFEFKFPDVGEGVHEGTLVKWLVKAGDAVKEDQILAEIETDKAVVEVPTPKTGKIIDLKFKAGDVIKVGDVLVTIDDGSGAAPAPVKKETEPKEAPKSEPKKGAPVPKKEEPKKEEPAPKKEIPKEVLPPAKAISVQKKEAPASKAAPKETPTAPPKAVPALSKEAQPAQKAAEPIPPPVGRVLAAPATRKLARDLGVDISKIKGSGPAGRVTHADVEAASGGKAPAAPSAGVPETAPFAAPVSPKEEAPSKATKAPLRSGEPPKTRQHAAKVTFEKYGRVIKVAYKGVRKAIGENMVRSATTIPHVVHMDWADVTELWDLRQTKKEFAANKGVKLTLLPFIMKAVCHALMKHPYMNATLDDEAGEIVLKKYYHLGFAVDTGRTLLVPNVKNADSLSIFGIAKEMQKLAELARDGDIKLGDMKGGTFTVTNIGSIGGEHFTPIIYHPECAILGIGRVKDKPVVHDGDVEVRKMLPLSLAFDHRIVDGAEAARFVNDIIAHLQDPDLLLLDAV